jgi:methylenetetrahydrofolate--tRNA-(uracil-5-)-methyltransferase
MRPHRTTGAHRTGNLAELVCSNSLKSDQPDTAPRLLKDEMRAAGGLLVALAVDAAVPAGGALAVDREKFSALVTEKLSSHPDIEIIREEATAINPDEITVIACGPLASPALAQAIARLTGSEGLYFFDALSPIVDGETINREIAFRAARYGKGGDDYVNCPMNRDEYDRFYDALVSAETVKPHEGMEEEEKYFEGCLPIEELARRGRDTLRFGPMKPVGLVDPRTGRQPYAVVQLRQDTIAGDHFSLVGFQTQLKWGEQARVLALIPGLEHAEFVRFGMVHRNTYINGPTVLLETWQTRARADLFFAGQISGVEGYVESAASGLVAGLNAAAVARGGTPRALPRDTAIGALAYYVSHADPRNYQPTNITFGIMPPPPGGPGRRPRRDERKAATAERALLSLEGWLGGPGR